MKIAFVYDVIYPYVKGGVEKRVWELAVRLARRGHDVHIFGMKYWEGKDTLVRDGVILHGVCPAQNLYAHGHRTIAEAVYFGTALLPHLAQYTFDIIDCQQFPYVPCLTAKCVATLKKTPLVLTWHEVWGDYWYTYLGGAGFFGKNIEHLVSRLTPHIVAVSATTADNLISLGCHGKITVIPNGVDLQHIRVICPAHEIPDIIFVGRLIKEKNVDLLIRAFGVLSSTQPDLKLLIIGEGPQQHEIANLICELTMEDRVQFRGFQKEHDEIIALMKSAKVCVIPSTREGFGITALEALACGIPVVTVDHPANAIRNLITEKNGFLSSLSAEDLADKILLALRHYTGMKNACIATAEAFDWDRITSDIETYYQSVIDAQT